MEIIMIAEKILMFTPERWSSSRRFSRWHSSTYKFNEIQKRALLGVEGNLVKAGHLRSVYEKIIPNLTIDENQLNKNGYSPGLNSAELTTVFEALIVSQYSAIDCSIRVLRASLGGSVRGFKDSTRKCFQSFERIEGLPEEFKIHLREASWYFKLMNLRDEIIHFSLGSNSLNKDTGKIQYIHTGIKIHDKPLVIDDCSEWLFDLDKSVEKFIEGIFSELCKTLKSEKLIEYCGFVQGRILTRYIDPTEEVNFNSGQCMSHIWFEKPEEPSCPFSEYCGAYQRKARI